MHELGHNVGLSHSHDEVSYGDSSCIMGSSPALENGPRICFNAAKSWELGWYTDAQLVLDVENIYLEYYKLIGVSGYGAISEDEYTSIKMVNTADKFDYYIRTNT